MTGLRRVAVALSIGALFGCDAVVEDPGGITSSPASGQRTYENRTWGFRVTLPDSTWGISADESPTSPQPNGLPTVVARFYAREPGSPFGPMVVVRPFALLKGETLDSLVTLFDAQYRQSYGNYEAGPQQATTVANERAVEWTFSTREVRTQGDHYMANRFLATVLVHGDQIYSFLSSGRPEVFPSALFQDIVRSLTFAK